MRTCKYPASLRELRVDPSAEEAIDPSDRSEAGASGPAACCPRCCAPASSTLALALRPESAAGASLPASAASPCLAPSAPAPAAETFAPSLCARVVISVSFL